MDTSKKTWPIISVFGIRNNIDTNPDFQRPAVWTIPQKQLLIDSILRGYDVPKFYWRLKSKKPDLYEVVDGQQRLRAIWEFLGGKYSLPKDSDPIDGIDTRGMKYEQFPLDLRTRCDTYNLDVVILEASDDEETREMFPPVAKRHFP